MQQQIQDKDATLAKALATKPVDYEAIIQHPLSNDSINFVKGLFKTKKELILSIKFNENGDMIK